MRMRALVMVLLGVLMVGVACGGSSDDAEGGAGSSDIALEDGAGSGGGPAARGGSTNDALAAQQVSLPPVGPRVIKTADLVLEVERGDLDEAVQAGISVAEERGGFVLSTRTQGDHTRTARLILRIPASDFEGALAELKEVGSVDSETVSGEDVSQEFVDLEARARNLRTQETVMLRLMSRAKTVGATIQVQRELEDIQLEIEQLEGRMRFLRDQTTFSTVSLSLSERGTERAEATLFERAGDIAGGITSAVVTGVVLGTGALLPIALLALVALVVVRVARPVFARLFP